MFLNDGVKPIIEMKKKISRVLIQNLFYLLCDCLGEDFCGFKIKPVLFETCLNLFFLCSYYQDVDLYKSVRVIQCRFLGDKFLLKLLRQI
jgi:hypothetical protein